MFYHFKSTKLFIILFAQKLDVRLQKRNLLRSITRALLRLERTMNSLCH